MDAAIFRTGEVPASDPWEACKLDDITQTVTTNDSGLAIDIVAIHDLDETPETAWIFVPRRLAQRSTKSPRDSDSESERSTRSIEQRIRLQLQAKVDNPKERRGPTKDDGTAGFKYGRITVEGRIQKAKEWQVVTANAEDENAKTESPRTNSPNAYAATIDPVDLNPTKHEAASFAKGSFRAGPNDSPQHDGPGTVDASVAEPSTSGAETRLFLSVDSVEKNVRIESKRVKSRKKKRSTSRRSSLHSQNSGDESEGSRGSFQQDIRRSTEFDTNVTSGPRKTVHLFREPTMIPAAFPGARIMSYTYPKVASTKAHEYLDKVAQKLLESLVKARADVSYRAKPILFIGYGFGGLIIQKLLIIATEALVEMTDLAQLLSMTAGLVLLNTPFPVLPRYEHNDSYSFPSSLNARQVIIMGRLKECGNKLDTGALWDSFDTKRVVEGQKIPLVWFYTSLTKNASLASKIKPERPLSELAQHRIFCMAMASENKRALSRFSSAKDPLYQKVVEQLRRCLIFKASERMELEDLLRALISLPDATVDVEDEQGRTALHYAASAPNPLAVTILISQGEANVVHQDNIGQIPLHTVIRRAAEVNPFERDFQKPFKDIIERLVENSGDIFQTDNESKTPWAYARGLAWIERLKDNRDMTSGPLISIPGQSLEPITPPGTLQLKACEEVRGDLVEFYTVTKAGKIQEKRNSERSYVVDMIYNLGPKTILERSRPRLKDMEVRQCRWLHLPGNNEQWVHDLFLSMKIIDTSLVGQHDRGSKHTLHMKAQAKRYKQILESRYWETKLNDRRVSLQLDRTEIEAQETVAKPVTMERDAIVLFMPILSYEPNILRSKISKAIRRILRHKKVEDDRDIIPLQAYLGDSGTKPLHCRRTLAQFAYYMLDSTESRDMDQVLYRWGRKKLEEIGKAEDASVLMVDQLWLWVLHDGTVITSFPNAWDNKQPHGLKKKLDEEIKRSRERQPIGSIDDLVHLIIKLSVDFFGRDAPGNIKFQEAFQLSIHDLHMPVCGTQCEAMTQALTYMVKSLRHYIAYGTTHLRAEREAKQLKYFKSLTKNLSMRTPTKTEKMNLNQKLKLRTLNEAQRTTLEERLNTRTLTEAQRTENIDKLFELNLETDLLVEMKELQDELNAVSSIFEQQRDVLRRLQELCSHDRNTEDETSSEPLKRPWMPNAERSPDALEQSEKDEPKGTSGIVHQAEEESKDSEKDMPILSNRSLVDDNLAIVMSNIQIIEDLQPYAEEVHTSIKGLLDLQQRQTNAWEARFSREGTQQSHRQGNIMLVFTLVTIVFLPLSFMSSFFALGVQSFPKDEHSGNVSWSLHTLSLLLFGISTLIFVPLSAIALYVNQIKSFTKETVQSFFRRRSNNSVDEREEESDDDETEQESDGDGDGNVVLTDILSEDLSCATYAPLFGKWQFHTRIPIIRKLWRRQAYINADDDSSDYLWDEGVNMDYPLHHFLFTSLRPKIRLVGLYKWFFRSKADDAVDSSGQSSLEETTQIVAIEEVSSTSGSDRPVVVAGGLRAKVPEPLKRLFVRKRAVHDVESIEEVN